MSLRRKTEWAVSDACTDLLATFGIRTRSRLGADAAPVLDCPERYAAGLIDVRGDAMSGKFLLLSTVDFFAQSCARVERARGMKTGSAGDCAFATGRWS